MSHYDWLEQNFEIFLKNLGLDFKHCQGIIVACGDKAYGYSYTWEKAGIHFYHGCALFLLSYLPPYDKEVRETENGWVAVDKWVIANYERFLPYLPKIEEKGGSVYGN